jgi:hypothetical protein
MHERRRREQELRDEPVLEPRAPAPHQLLALQQSAGNRAVTGMLQRQFYEHADDGTYIWHPEKADQNWAFYGETTYWLLPFWRYPVLERAQPIPVTSTVTEEEKPSKRKRPKRKKKAAPQPEPEAEVHTTAPPPPVTVAPTEESEEEEDDDAGFTVVKSKDEKRQRPGAPRARRVQQRLPGAVRRAVRVLGRGDDPGPRELGHPHALREQRRDGRRAQPHALQADRPARRPRRLDRADAAPDQRPDPGRGGAPR